MCCPNGAHNGPTSAGRFSNLCADSYRCYTQLGGIINEKDYRRIVERAKVAITHPYEAYQFRCSIEQARRIAEYIGLKLETVFGRTDPRILLYVVMRNDRMPEGVKYHHSQMCDQNLFGEALRMVADAGSLELLKKAYPNINFNFTRSEQPN